MNFRRYMMIYHTDVGKRVGVIAEMWAPCRWARRRPM